jgi:hypothetical protein
MIELILFNNVYVKSHDPNSPTLSPEQKEDIMRNVRSATMMATLIYLLIFVLALYRAMACSSNTPDSRALHLFFASVSPVMYIVFSYLVPGFDPTNKMV